MRRLQLISSVLALTAVVTWSAPAAVHGASPTKPILPTLELTNTGLFTQVVGVASRSWANGATFQINTYDRIEVVQFVGQDVSSVARPTGGERVGRAYSQGSNYRFIDISGSESLRAASMRLGRPGLTWLYAGRGAAPASLASLPGYPFQVIDEARAGLKSAARKGSVWTLKGTCRKASCTTVVTFDSGGRLLSVKQTSVQSGTISISVLAVPVRQPLVRGDNSAKPDELYV